MQKSPTSNRILSYDMLRILAAIAVVMIHVSAVFVISSPKDSLSFAIANLCDSLSRIGVPVFTMISGSLMLNESKKLEIKDMLVYALRIWSMLLFWSVFYSIYYNIIIPIIFSRKISSIETVLTAIMDGHYHLWFLFMIIGLYIVTPILRLFVKKENKKYIMYLVSISVLIKSIVPLVNFFCTQFICEGDFLLNYLNKFKLPLFNEYLTYYILGWYLSTFKPEKKQRTLIYVLGCFGFLITFLGSQFLTTETLNAYDTFYSDGIINVFCYSVAVFVFGNHYLNIKNSKHQNVVLTLSKLTFGVYIIHIAVLTTVDLFTNHLGFHPLRLMINFILTTIISFIGTYIISKIPILKKLIRG